MERRACASSEENPRWRVGAPPQAMTHPPTHPSIAHAQAIPSLRHVCASVWVRTKREGGERAPVLSAFSFVVGGARTAAEDEATTQRRRSSSSQERGLGTGKGFPINCGSVGCCGGGEWGRYGYGWVEWVHFWAQRVTTLLSPNLLVSTARRVPPRRLLLLPLAGPPGRLRCSSVSFVCHRLFHVHFACCCFFVVLYLTPLVAALSLSRPIHPHPTSPINLPALPHTRVIAAQKRVIRGTKARLQPPLASNGSLSPSPLLPKLTKRAWSCAL